MTSPLPAAEADNSGPDRTAANADNPHRELLDNRSAPCAVGLIKAARLMASLPAGAVLEIWSRDRFAPMEVPMWAERDGYQVEQRGQEGRWPLKYFVFIVTKPV